MPGAHGGLGEVTCAIGSTPMRIPVRLRSSLKWLLPGLGVKRWLLVLAVGVALAGVGVGILLWQVKPLSMIPIYSQRMSFIKYPDKSIFSF